MATATIKPLRGNLKLPFELAEDMTAPCGFNIIDDSGAKIVKVNSKISNIQDFEKAYYNAICLVSPGVVVVAYRDVDNANYVTVIAGEIQADKSINWGTSFVVYAGLGYYLDITDHGTNQFCVTFRGSGNLAFIRAGTVDASQNITMGTATQSSAGAAYYNRICKVATNKIVSVFRDNGAGGYLIGEAATISGNVITSGLGTQLVSASVSYFDVCSPDTDKIAFSYYYSSKGWTAASAITGIAIGLPGTVSEFNASTIYSSKIESPSINKVVVIYRNYGDGQKPYLRCTTLTGTTFDTWGAAKALNGATSYYQGIAVMDTDKIACMFSCDVDPYGGGVVRVNIVGKELELDHKEDFTSERVTYLDSVGTDTDEYAMVWYNNTLADGRTLVIEGLLNSLPLCMGVLEESGLTGSVKTCAMLGATTKVLSGLTPGQLQYLQSDGSISNISSSYQIGMAIDTDEMFIGKDLIA